MEAVCLVAAVLIMEFIDSALGLMFGTVLSPLLIIMNYNAKEVVPSILISQAIGGFINSWRHHRLRNADFNPGTTDRSIAVTVTWFGVFASLIGVFLSAKISPKALNSYIGILVLVIGLLILSGRTLLYSKRKI